MPDRSRLFLAVTLFCASLAAMATDRPAGAQGHQHMAIYSTEEGGGDLTVSPLTWNFEEQTVQTFPAFCAAGSCVFNTDNPALLASTQTLGDGLFPLSEGTQVSIEIVALDAAASVMFGAQTLDQPGETAVVGTMGPDFHTHPTWQLVVPENLVDVFDLSFRLRASGYGDSPDYPLALTNQAAPPTCAGDCNGDQRVTVDELIRIVSMVQTNTDVAQCPGIDTDEDERLSIAEVVGAVAKSVQGCSSNTLAEIQKRIFTPSCAVPFCHNAETPLTNNLSLIDAATSYRELVGVRPVNAAAANAGLELVAPGDPDGSFLVVKVEGPPSFDFGSQMPFGSSPLSAEQMQLIRDWIAEGANP